jgi:L-threonylcarbamoyladenylate synthase
LLILKANKLNGIKIFDKSLKNGVPVIFPTDTIYGIGAFINDLKANEQIFLLFHKFVH